MERLTFTENQTEAAAVRLSAIEAAGLNATQLVQVTPLPDRRWEMRPCLNKVGAIRSNGCDIVVRPKAPFSSLLFMLAYAQDQGFRPAEFGGTASDEVWPALGETLIRLGERALERGVLRGYVTKDDSLPVVRGRIRISDQLTRRHGIPIPLEVRFSALSMDIPENQILRAALRHMASVERLPSDMVRGLRHLEGRLAGAALLVPGALRPTWTPNRLNERYIPALRLAGLILDLIGLTTTQGNHPMASFVVNMADVFEDFVGAALGGALMLISPGVTRKQYPTYLTYDHRFPVRPDLVHIARGRVQAVYDVKYKLEEKTADLYQMHAYCTILGADIGHLIYAGSRFGSDGSDALIRNSGVTVRTHPLDVAVPPVGLLDQIHKIALSSLPSG